MIEGVPKTLRRSFKRLKTQCFLDLSVRPRDSLFIAGDGRSGTTWVSNVVNYDDSYRFMFEPFHPHYVERCRGFRLFQYLRPECRSAYHLGVARNVLTGRLRHQRIDKFNKRYIYSKRLVKDIFPHLFLKWLHVNFPDSRLVLLLRHPIAVAVSKQKLMGKQWMTDPLEFLAQNELAEDYLRPYEGEIRAASTFFEKQIVIWCIIHQIPLRQFEKGQIHLAFYERFCVEPEDEIRRLFAFIGKPLREDDYARRIAPILGSPSQTSRKESAINTGQGLVDAWRKHVTDSQVTRSVEILKCWGLDSIYSDQWMPNVTEAYSLLGKAPVTGRTATVRAGA